MAKLISLREFRKNEIRSLLLENDEALEEALLAIFDQQTAEEKRTMETKERNKVGFTGVDAKFLTQMARWVLRSEEAPGNRLSPERRRWLRKRIPKYAGQLMRISWFFVDHSVIDSAPDTAPETVSAGLGESGQGQVPVPRYESRTQALEDALRRIEQGRSWVREHRSNPAHRDSVVRANVRLVKLMEWVDQIVLGADRDDLRSEAFRSLARFARPCVSCKGTQKRENGECFRCRGKGFQTQSDEERNARYDARRVMRT